MKPRYAVQIHRNEGDGPLQEIRRDDAGDALEPARIALAATVDAMLDEEPALIAVPDTVRFIDRADAQRIDLYLDHQWVARVRLLDLSLRHCPSCTCGLPAR